MKNSVFRGSFYVTTVHLDVATESFKSLDMLINGANAKIATAGETDKGSAETAKLSSDQIIGCAHFADQLVRSNTGSYAGGVDFYGVLIEFCYFDPNLLEDLQRNLNICDIGKILDDTLVFGKNGREYDGNCSVFHS